MGGLKGDKLEDFESGKPFVDLDWDDLGFTSSPKEWEGRMGKDFIYLKHGPCGRVLRLVAGFVGSRAARGKIDDHSGSCPKKAAT